MPSQNNADFVFNSAMETELPVLKVPPLRPSFPSFLPQAPFDYEKRRETEEGCTGALGPTAASGAAG